jgi:hypothetical protein
VKRTYTVAARCEFVAGFLRGVRRHRQLDRSTLVFCVERNTGQEVGTLYDYVARQALGLVHLYRDSDDEVGLWTDFEKKNLYLHATRTFLEHADLALCADWVARDAEAMRRELYQQLVRIREFTVEGKHALSSDRTSWSGKLTQEGKRSDRHNDDLAMSLMQCLYLLENIVTGFSPIPAAIVGTPQRNPNARVTKAAKRARVAFV